MPSTIFSSAEFWDHFIRDMKQARSRLIIQSPFVTARRVKLMATELRSLSIQGVAICVFLQEPQNWQTDPEALGPESAYAIKEFSLLVEMLRSLGAHVNLRKAIHAKFAIVDEYILWEGSLNILSFANTKEHMRRWESRSETRAAIEKHALDQCSDCKVNHLNYLLSATEGKSMSEMGRLLAAQRARLRLTQRQLASYCKISPGRIAQIEGGCNITMKSFLAIAQKLQLSILLLPDPYLPGVGKFLNSVVSLENPIPGSKGSRVRIRATTRKKEPIASIATVK